MKGFVSPGGRYNSTRTVHRPEFSCLYVSTSMLWSCFEFEYIAKEHIVDYNFFTMEYKLPARQQKIWRIKTPAPTLQQILAHNLGISTITAQLLINRGIYTVEQGSAFLTCALEQLHSPLLLRDMKEAVARVLQAVQAGENILIYGDYDTDGITATVLLLLVTQRLGARSVYFIPNRLEHGYGLRQDILQQARERGTNLVVTVDCGISATAEAAWTEQNGMELIVTDHHEPPPVLPRAVAVLNPKRLDSNYPFTGLAGVGVALKFAQALLEAAGAEKHAWLDYLDLACLGTIADIVPLFGENRILVKHGLTRLAHTVRPGLQALLKVSGVDPACLGADEVGFRLAPRLNAAGRIGSPDLAVRLLLTDSVSEAAELANALHQGNQRRQELEATVLEEAMQILESQPALAAGKIIVLHSVGWHQGVIGIVASRLVDRFYRPVILIAIEGEKGRGSARSVPGFNIYQAISHCQEYLLSAGGHAMAAGLTIVTDRLEEFCQAISAYADQMLEEEQLRPGLDVDGLIDIAQVSEELVNEINLLQPFGHSNPAPLLGCREAAVLAYRRVGRNSSHLKMRLRSGEVILDSIGFNLGVFTEALAKKEVVDLAFAPGVNEYKGHRSLQLEVKDLGLPAVLELTGQEIAAGDELAEPFLGTTRSLLEKNHELFTPEFLLTTLKEIEMPAVTGVLEPISSMERRKIELVDWRDAIERQLKLRELVGRAGPSLVITACGYQTIETAYFLQDDSPSRQDKAAFCHQLLPEKKVAENMARFKAGALQALVTTPAFAWWSSLNLEQVIIYHLPYDLKFFKYLNNIVKTGGKVYLFYGRKDLQSNLTSLEMLAPDRERLAFVYAMLRRQAGATRQFFLDLDRAAKEMSNAGYTGAHEITITVALKIFTELGLMLTVKKGRVYKISLLTAPRVKQNLTGSKTYRRLHRIKEESTAWMNTLLTEPVDCLRRFLMA
ncbi:MAG: Single-stranded-DNA-specific exonuclease RecJ [Pelotomaculum sp. PtaB.Bin104]|nr:MAG: Single-stranded-DNA-specific exonuclease RecJ [Pelotomaculum sp. PtaB.Bin104]